MSMGIDDNPSLVLTWGVLFKEKAELVLRSGCVIVFLGQVFMCSHMKLQFGQNTQ